MAKRPKGVCCLCGEVKRLTYEHIPPKSAYNDYPVLYKSLTLKEAVLRSLAPLVGKPRVRRVFA